MSDEIMSQSRKQSCICSQFHNRLELVPHFSYDSQHLGTINNLVWQISTTQEQKTR